MRGEKRAFTVVELLVVAALLGIVLTIVTAYFIQQSQVSRRTQARNEAEINARMVAEIIVQDLQIAGSNVVVNGGVASDVQIGCSGSSANKCISTPGGGEGNQDQLKVTYATSLRSSDPCRKVAYSFSGLTLRRSEVLCTTEVPAPQAFAENIQQLNIVYLCANETEVDDPADCYSANSFPRQATVTVTGRSGQFADVTAEVTLSTSMPNLRF